MASEPCDACEADVPIGGGIGGFWSSTPQRTGGMTLELTDGSEHFLCFACIEQLPDDPSAADVRALAAEPPDEAVTDGTGDGGGGGTESTDDAGGDR